jgi:hypothetical protein
MQARDDIISALEKELQVQREKVRDAAIIKAWSAYSQ